MRRTRVVVGKVMALALLVCALLPAGLLLAPQKLRDYAYRELAYRVIVDDVTKGITDDTEIAEALLAFVASHEYAPNGAPVVDDTVFNDLVRGIGYCDQQAWGLGTLLAKKNVPGTLLMLRGRQAISGHTVATVYLNGQWRILDPFYKQVFPKPSGELATFEDLQRDPALIRRASPKLVAMEQYKKGFVDAYASYFEPQFPPDKWKSLTELKNPSRRIVSGILDGYVRLLGHTFVNRFQDAYLWRALASTPDGDVFLRARHYDLFVRPDDALAMYRRLLTEFPASPYVEDALYFMGKLNIERGQWPAAGEAFDTLFARFGPDAKWADSAHYFNGRANEAARHWEKAAAEYAASAGAEQTDSALRLIEMAKSSVLVVSSLEPVRSGKQRQSSR